MPGVRQQPRVATAGPCAAPDTRADLHFVCTLASYPALFPIIKVSFKCLKAASKYTVSLLVLSISTVGLLLVVSLSFCGMMP